MKDIHLEGKTAIHLYPLKEKNVQMKLQIMAEIIYRIFAMSYIVGLSVFQRRSFCQRQMELLLFIDRVIINASSLNEESSNVKFQHGLVEMNIVQKAVGCK
ncbi:hypothetical protein TNCT_199821 [Trichonephila clavata]|uniref:Uncharacterized protein n=1 Tax=Trichonephila clavata TaxID=2740835 RepID=A0A8X6GUL0_TRICU|nr:hypothetical protein TNCT_199821 [Trichonephila clavata]